LITLFFDLESMKAALVLLQLLVVCSYCKGADRLPNNRARRQGEMKIAQLQSIQDLNNLLDVGRQKIAESHLVFLEQAPSAAVASTSASASGSASGSAVDLSVAPPQLQPLALPSYGPSLASSPVDELADIQREQMSLRQKKVMVAQQKRIIQDSEDSATKLQQLIAVNKQIEEKNEQALAAAGTHLLDRIKAYSDSLAQEQSAGTGASGVTALAAPSVLMEQGTEHIAQQQDQSSFAQFQAEIQSTIRQQSDTIQRMQDLLTKRRHHRRRRRNSEDTDIDTDAEESFQPMNDPNLPHN